LHSKSSTQASLTKQRLHRASASAWIPTLYKYNRRDGNAIIGGVRGNEYNADLGSSVANLKRNKSQKQRQMEKDNLIRGICPRNDDREYTRRLPLVTMQFGIVSV
jgi:hypothetical protein